MINQRLNPKQYPVIISCLQLLALKEILRSPSFQAKDPGELQWLIDLIDKAATLDATSEAMFRGFTEAFAKELEQRNKDSHSGK